MIASREFVIKKLAELITEPKKKYSQNFLTDNNVVKKAVEALIVEPCQEVIEIGPGLGALSEEIVSTGLPFTVFEIDEIMVHHLKKQFARYSNLTIVEGDFLKQNLSNYSNKKVAVISNLPYHLTTPIIEKIITSKLNLTTFVFMIQKEVAARIFAKTNTKEYSPLSIMLNYLGEIETVTKVGKDKFIPSPNVDSVILKLKVTRDRNFEFENKLFSLLNALFSMRRKTILNNLIVYLKSKERAIMLLEKSNIPSNLRAEQLTLENYLVLCEKISSV